MLDSELSMMQKQIIPQENNVNHDIYSTPSLLQGKTCLIMLNLRLHVVLDVSCVRLLVKGGLLKLVVQNNIHTADSGSITALILNFCWRIATNQCVIYVSLCPADHLQKQESMTVADITPQTYWSGIVQPMLTSAELIRKSVNWLKFGTHYFYFAIAHQRSYSEYGGFIGHNLQRCPKLSSLYVHGRAATQF